MYGQHLLVSLFFLSVVLERGVTLETGECPNVRSPISSIKKRRHIAFPSGSTCSLTTSITKAFMTHAPSGWFLVIEANLNFKLPDTEFISVHSRRKLHHRQKREFWETLQHGLDLKNINGRSCIIRSICEAKKELAPPGSSLVHDILRIIFTAPLHEQEFTEEIGLAYEELLEPNFCDRPNDCPLSLLHFVLDLNKQI